MNKEAKIGLTIILVLMVIFVAAVAKRLYTSNATDEAFATEDKGEKKSEKSANSAKESSDIIDKAKSAAISSSQPTVVAATTSSGQPPAERQVMTTCGIFHRIRAK